MNSIKINLALEQQTINLGYKIANNCNLIKTAITIYLSGDLGAGKTTLARGFMKFFKVLKVKSPTYSIVESYKINQRFVHHFDCYRILDYDELEYLGIRDYQDNNNICIFEWAEKAGSVINKPDLTIKIDDTIKPRVATLFSHNDIGNKLIKDIKI